ncbi:MAG TPA: Hpt domain-containing protein, partial [Plasticicumulans sp.]|nr:Hpt domain-containing protein [Plasticicumulans sp.]
IDGARLHERLGDGARAALCELLARAGDGENELLRLIVDNRRAELQRRAHQLKGVGGALCAHALAEAAAALEKRLRADAEGHEPLPVVETIRLADEYARVLGELREAGYTPAELPPAAAGIDFVHGLARLKALCAATDLEALALARRLGEAQSVGWSAARRRDWAAAVAALERYDFSAAEAGFARFVPSTHDTDRQEEPPHDSS